MSSRGLGPVPSRRATVLTALMSLVVLAVIGGSGPSDARATSPDRPWSGYQIPVDGHADGGWIGGRRLADGSHVYRIDPHASGAASTYRKATVLGSLGSVGHSDLARVAWILSTYGNYPLAAQSSAVDAATYHLLVGGTFRINGPRGSARIQQASYPRYITKYAREMLSKSARFAGPYFTLFQTTPGRAGGITKATLKVTSAAGKPVRKQAVVFHYPGRPSVTTTTDDEGIARAAIVITKTPLTQITAVVRRLPQWRLLVRAPLHHGASRVAVAGLHYNKRVHPKVAATGAQVVTITNARSVYSTNQHVGGQWTLVGHGGARQATISLFGPFPTDHSHCSGAPAGTVTKAVDADGTFELPGGREPHAGYFRYAVSVAGNAANRATSACGSPVRVRAVPTVSIRTSSARIRAGDPAHSVVTVTGLQSEAKHVATSRLFGPFATAKAASCAASKVFTNWKVEVDDNGTFETPAVRPSAHTSSPLWFLWTTSLSGSELSTSAGSSCRAAGTFLEVLPS